MPDLFGLDIAGIVNNALTSAGGLVSGTLTSYTPGTRSVNRTGGTNPTSTSHTFQGFVEVQDGRQTEAVVSPATEVFVNIMGASVDPVAVPKVNDQVTIDGSTYTLTKLASLDPAEALYKFEAGQ